MAGSIEQRAHSAPEEALFAFRPITFEDFPLLFGWLRNPGVAAWWDDPPATMAEFEGKYVPRLDGSEAVFGFIASYADEPIGYLQWYRLADEPEHPACGLVPYESAAVDLFIGEDEFRGKGYGPVMIRAFLRGVVFAQPEIASCAIDPCRYNQVAIAAYSKAGFRPVGVVPSPGERCDVLVMIADRTAFLV